MTRTGTPLLVHQRRVDRWLVYTTYRTLRLANGKRGYVPIRSFDVTDQVETILRAYVKKHTGTR